MLPRQNAVADPPFDRQRLASQGTLIQHGLPKHNPAIDWHGGVGRNHDRVPNQLGMISIQLLNPDSVHQNEAENPTAAAKHKINSLIELSDLLEKL